ncbi:EcsC family protein [Bacillus suaedae]|uniref:EcsC family protein n=1 Tax=Halalkalibacter suaedae TaxID=2822140 RepID=UPI003211AB3A
MSDRLSELQEWEERYFLIESSDVAQSYHYYHERMLSKINEEKKEKWLAKMDSCLAHLQSWLLQSRSFEETKRRVITHARIFDSSLSSVDDLRRLPIEKLDYLAEQLMAKQRLLSFGQGGLTGMGGLFLLLADLPALAIIQLRSLQHLSFVYGYDSRHPMEQMVMLKLFHIATLPKAYQHSEWDRLWQEVEEHQHDQIFYQGDETVFNEQWLQQMSSQLAKSFVITMLRKKLIQGVPLLGIALGAGMNYRLSQQVIEVGQHFYQKRRLLEENA